MIPAVQSPSILEKKQNGRTIKDDDEPAFSLTGAPDGVMIQTLPHGWNEGVLKPLPSLGSDPGSDRNELLVSPNQRIRRLTPIECERLQGFPDDWTAGVSDTQRYKMMGNAVTVNVIEAIGRRILETEATAQKSPERSE